MSDQSASGFELWQVQDITESVFREFVENGTIELGQKTAEEILAQFYGIMDRVIPRSPEWNTALDYRHSVLSRAKAEADGGNDWIAITLYAISIEHIINGILGRAFERKGYSHTVVMPLLRDLRTHTKASALWIIAGLPAISDENMRLLDRILEFRNTFVHYKWRGYDETKLDLLHRQLRDIVERSEEFVAALFSIESSAFWNGRDNELIEHLRRDIERRWRGRKRRERRWRGRKRRERRRQP